MARTAQDLRGRRFGMLRPIENAPKSKSIWVCMCDCGNAASVPSGALILGNTKSCGCLRGIIQRQKREHLMARTRPHQAWTNMLSRCRNPKSTQYFYYGGRGIKVCPEWESFVGFWSDMGPSWRAGLTLDRMDNNGGYSKDNCRWVDKKTQARNRRSNRVVQTPSGALTLAAAAEQYGISQATLQARLKSGWPTERLFAPLRGSKISGITTTNQ